MIPPTIHSTLRGPSGLVYPQVLKAGDVVMQVYDKGSFVFVVDHNTDTELRFSHYRPLVGGSFPIRIDYVWDHRTIYD